MRLRTVAFLLASVSCLPMVHADNWPCWRGPRYDGSVNEEDIPTRWSSTENIYWRVPVPGVGHSSPIVWDDAVFLTTCNLESRSRELLRIDRQSGKVLWSRKIAVAPIEPMHRDNTPASATPVTDGQHVYVVFAVDGKLLLAAVNFDGQIVWSNPVGDFEASHGFCTNLVLDDDKIYLSGLQDGQDAFVACLRKDTGEVAWKVPRSKKIRSYSTPMLCSIRGTAAVLLSGAEQTIAYDRANGKTLWEIDGPGSKTVSSLVISPEHDMAYVCGGRDNLFFAIDLQNVNRASESSPKIAWSAKRGIPYMTSPLLAHGKLHVLSDEGVYSCFEPKSGRLLNQHRAVGNVRSSMVANRKNIYITEESGRTTVVNAESEWSVVAENDLGEGVVASPAISNGDIFIRGEKHLFLIRDEKQASSN